MKKVLLILFMSTSARAACPLYSYPENHKLDQEINNICDNILNPKVATINGAAYSPITFNSAGYIIGTVVQAIQVTDTNTTAAVGTTYTTTNLSTNITPKSATHKIRISVTGRASDTSLNASNTYISIFRGSTDLSNGNGLVGIDGATAASIETPVSMVFLDSPATTTVTTYIVKIKTTSAAAGVWNTSGGTCTLLLEEIAQ